MTPTDYTALTARLRTVVTIGTGVVTPIRLEAADAIDALAARVAEADRLIKACLTHLRDNGDFPARAELLQWGQDFIARAILGGTK